MKLLYLQNMTNEELVTSIICKNCSIGCNIGKQYNCDTFLNALQVANEKDKQLQKYVENEVKSFNNY